MRINLLSIFPDMFDAVSEYGMTRRAIEQGALQLQRYDLRDYCEDRHRVVDDRPFGGGPGMVMKPEPLARALDDIASSQSAATVIYLSPQGETLTQDLVQELSAKPALTLLCGRYEAVDERIINSRVEREISIGDYVLAGGELAAMVVIDAMARLLPGVLGNSESALQDSFSDNLLDCPHFTRPAEFEEVAIPSVLLSGDHHRISQWRRQQALGRTWERRPDMFNESALTAEDQRLLEAYKLELNDEHH